MKNNKNIIQKDLIVEFFKKNPNRNIEHPEVVDWVVETYKKRTGKVFRDPDRAIRQLAQSGFLIKIAQGIYKYDPQMVNKKELHDFTAAQKAAILKIRQPSLLLFLPFLKAQKPLFPYLL